MVNRSATPPPSTLNRVEGQAGRGAPVAWPSVNAPITIRDISVEEHLRWLCEQPSASFLQTPGWGRGEDGLAAESRGLVRGRADGRRGARAAPQLPQDRAVARLRARGAVHRLGLPAAGRAAPRPARPPQGQGGVRTAARAARRDPPLARGHDQGGHRRPGDVRATTRPHPTSSSRSAPPSSTTLRRLGFRHLVADDGFTAGQPEYVFQVPLAGGPRPTSSPG